MFNFFFSYQWFRQVISGLVLLNESFCAHFYTRFLSGSFHSTLFALFTAVWSNEGCLQLFFLITLLN